MVEIEDVLKEIVGAENVSSSPSVLEAYRFVAMSQDFPVCSRPAMVVLPSSEAQVSRILSLANRSRIAVVTRGQATGFQGENVPLEGGIMMDMSLMNRLIEIDEDNMVVIAETGCTMNTLAYELDKRGLVFPIRPWFSPNMHIGAFIINNGTGDFGSAHGRAGDHVRGLEVALPSGEIARLGSWAYPHGYGACHRYTGGPDLIGLFINSGGVFGVVTKVALRVINKRRLQWYRTFGWRRSRLADLCRALYECQRYGISTFHLQNYWSSRGIIGAGIAPWPAAALGISEEELVIANLIQVAENEDLLRIMARDTTAICEANGGADLGPDLCKASQGPPYYAINLSTHYRFRPGVVPPYEGINWAYFYHCTPTLKFPEYWDYFEEVVDKYGFHDRRRGAGMLVFPLDAAMLNPYPTFCYRPEVPEEVVRMRKAYDEMQEGLAKMGVLPYTFGAYLPRDFMKNLGPSYELMKSIKRLMDPNNILNPSQL
ncbi:MAG: FAD-binding oxidoreductase [Pseudomonadota bacterium]